MSSRADSSAPALVRVHARSGASDSARTASSRSRSSLPPTLTFRARKRPARRARSRVPSTESMLIVNEVAGASGDRPSSRHSVLGLSPEAPPTSFTIGIDSVEGTRDRVRRARDFRALKVKVGGAEDLERLEAVREESDAPLRVDANEGWTLEAARELMPELIRLGVEFVEQPFPAADIDSFNALKRAAPAPARDRRRGLPEPGATSRRPPPTPTAST